MKTLVTSDFHLSDNPQDEYRWGIFDWLKKVVSGYKVDYVYILGDISERKDKHNSRFVNKVVEALTDLQVAVQVIIVAGNHDGVDKGDIFFKFLNSMGLSNIVFIVEPGGVDKDLFLPHSRHPEVDWIGLDFTRYNRVFMHQAVSGCLANNGFAVDKGLSQDHSMFSVDGVKVYSGDVHKPQTMFKKKLTYVGAPYHVYFGDQYDGRVLLLDDNGAETFICPPKGLFLKRHSFSVGHPDELDKCEVREGDQCKVKLVLDRSEACMWEQYRKQVRKVCGQKQLQLCGLELTLTHTVMADSDVDAKDVEEKYGVESDEDVVRRYARKEGLDDRYVDVAVGMIQ